jgi:NADPH:quinone reductase-like Zn-dependent oxidoreductase
LPYEQNDPAVFSGEPFMNSTKPRVVVITGAAAGVGRATAQMFAKTEGAHIGLIARGMEALEGAKRDVESLGGKAIIIQCDVTNADGIEAAAERVEQELGPIDVWVNVAMTSVFAFVKETGALLSVGAHQDVRRVLSYLQATSAVRWTLVAEHVVGWLTVWNGIQMDETALPILLWTRPNAKRPWPRMMWPHFGRWRGKPRVIRSATAR